MQFTHDFRRDLGVLMRQIDLKEPFAFARLSDGEAAIINMRPVPTADGWTVPASPTAFTSALLDSLDYNAQGYHLGISCPCCYKPIHERLMGRKKIPDDRCTFSTLFVNGNFERFHELAEGVSLFDPNKSALVCPRGRGKLAVPLNLVNHPNAMPFINVLVDCLLELPPGPILVAAGPASSIIIHLYWMRSKNRQTIIDIGSVLDMNIHEQGGGAVATRGYHSPDNPNRRKICQWQ